MPGGDCHEYIAMRGSSEIASGQLAHDCAGDIDFSPLKSEALAVRGPPMLAYLVSSIFGSLG